MEEIKEEQAISGISLAFFRPRSIEELVLKPVSPKWTSKQLATLRQQSFFDEDGVPPLEKVPYDFKYRYQCDDPTCKGHQQKIVDWEIYQSYRSWKPMYGEGWEEKLRQRYEREMQEQKDTHFFVGTMLAHPQTWIVIGLFYPPRVTFRQDVLFTDV